MEGDTMKNSKYLRLGFAFALSLIVVSAGYATQKKMSKTKEVMWLAGDMKFKPLAEGVSMAVLWGDPEKGPYGALTKFEAGTNHALHSHANDIKMVVISGAYIYGTEKGKKKFGPGSYLLIPGGRQHTSGAEVPTLFFNESPGKFTLDFASKKTK